MYCKLVFLSSFAARGFQGVTWPRCGVPQHLWLEQSSTGTCGKDAMKAPGVYLRQPTEEWNHHRHLLRSTEKDRSLPSGWTNHSVCVHFVSCFASEQSTAFTVMLAGNFTFIKKVNLPWNKLCSTETQQGVQTLGTENRGSCQGEKSHRMSVSDGTAGVCHYSLMAKHCRCCYESKMLSQHNCCFSSASEQKQSRVMHKLQWSLLWRPMYFYC